MVTPLDEEDDASITRQLEINLHAVIHGTQEAMRRMRPRGTGHIVNIASLAGRAAAPGPGDLLRDQARRDRPLRGRPRRAARHRRRGHRRHAGLRQDRARLRRAGPAHGQARHARGDRRATVDAIKVPRFDVWAPKRLAAIIWLGAVIPRTWREAVSRAMNSNSVVSADPGTRAAYEARAAASAPAADETLEEARAA